MLLGTIGVPLAALFLLFFFASLFFKRSRAFAWRLFAQSLGTGLAIGVVMWFIAQSSLPPPFSYQAALTVVPFGFGVGGFVMFFQFFRKTKNDGVAQ
jgi:hypothetical protein